MTAANGTPVYRGYIASRPIDGSRVPQHVQNLVLRDHARRKGFHFLLSATEFVPDACFRVLEGVVSGADGIDGILIYSLFMLPDDAEARREIYRRAFAKGLKLVAAVEDVELSDWSDVARVETIMQVRAALRITPRTLGRMN